MELERQWPKRRVALEKLSAIEPSLQTAITLTVSPSITIRRVDYSMLRKCVNMTVNNELVSAFLNPYRVMAWEWKDFPLDSLEDCVWGKEVVCGLRASTELSDITPSMKAIQELRQKQIYHGIFAQLQFLHARYAAHYDALRNSYQLQGDNTAEIKVPPFDAIFRINTLFADFVASGRRLSDKMERELMKLCGEQSENYRGWKSCSSQFFDSRLDYAVMQELRNEMEHGFAFISTVNPDQKDGTAKLAFNIEAGVLNTKIKSRVRERIIDYRNEQLKRRCSPWLSVGGMVESYHEAITMLYALCIKILMSLYDESPISEEAKAELAGHNCVYWHAKESDPKCAYSLDRVYPLPNSCDRRSMHNELLAAGGTLIKLNPRNEELVEMMAEGFNLDRRP